MPQPAIMDVLTRRKNRMIAIILSTKEDLVDPYTSEQDSAEFRKVILDQINSFSDLACDLLKSVDIDAVVINEEFLDILSEIRSAVVGK